uniref:Uncharacterized protein n=1 Tax=Eutreptiella gymnastica TaxID=73025 RepID=A0A7S1N8G6_9EUGL
MSVEGQTPSLSAPPSDPAAPSEMQLLEGNLTVLQASGGGTGLTGWNKPANQLNFGNSGLTGHNWLGLDVCTDFGKAVVLGGVRIDYHKRPYKVLTSDDNKTWTEQASGLTKDHTFDPPLRTRYARMCWDRTDGTSGLHCQFLGPVDTSAAVAPQVTATAAVAEISGEGETSEVNPSAPPSIPTTPPQAPQPQEQRVLEQLLADGDERERRREHTEVSVAKEAERPEQAESDKSVVIGLQPEPPAIVWKRRLILLVSGLCLFCHLFVLGLSGQMSYTAAVEVQLTHLERTCKVISSILTSIYDLPSSKYNTDQKFEIAKEYLNWFNFDMLIDTHEITIARKGNTEGNTFTLNYVTPLKFNVDCPESKCSTNSTTSNAMVRALSGQTGSLYSQDYRGNKQVLAAHTYIEGFDVGLVYKVDEDPYKALLTNTLINVLAVTISLMWVALAAQGVSLDKLLQRYSRVCHIHSDQQEPSKFPYMVVMLALVIVEMLLVSILVGVITCAVMDNVYLQQNEREQLLDTQLLAGMLDMQAKYFGVGVEDTVKLVNEINRQTMTGSSEIVLANKTGGVASYLTAFKFAADCTNLVCGQAGMDSSMSLALQGSQGAAFETDYRPADVLSGYGSVPTLSLGLVLKDDYWDVRGPMRKAAALAAGVSVAVVIVVLIVTIVVWCLMLNCLKTQWFESPVTGTLIVQETRNSIQKWVSLIVAISIVLCYVTLLGLQYKTFQQHTKVNMLVGAELVGSALDLSITMANNTSVNSSVLQAMLAYVTHYNTHQLFGPLEISVATEDVTQPGNIGYATRPKFWSLCQKDNCSSLNDEAMVAALSKHTGMLKGSDYRPDTVVASHTYASQTSFGVVYKEDSEFLNRRFATVIRETVLGMGVFIIFMSIVASTAVYFVIQALITMWTDPKQQDDASVAKANTMKVLSLVLVAVVLGLIDSLVLTFGIVHPHRRDIEDQDSQILNNLKLVSGMLTVLADNTASQADMIQQSAEWTNYLNYQILPRHFELELVQLKDGQLNLLSYPKFKTACEDRKCKTSAAAYTGIVEALNGKTGTAASEDYQPRAVMEAYNPIPSLNAAMVLKVDTHQMRVDAEQHVYAETFGAGAILIAGILGAVVAMAYKLHKMENYIRHPRIIVDPPMDPLVQKIVFGAGAVVFAVLVAIIFILWCAIAEGYGFMVRQTVQDLDVGVQLVKGVLSSTPGISMTQVAALMNYYNYQVLPTTYELVIAQEKPDGGSEYLTQLKFKSECHNYGCAEQPEFIKSALKGQEQRLTSTLDYRPEDVISASASLSGSETLGIGLKVDREELRLSWERRVIQTSSLVALLIWIVVSAVVGLWVMTIMKAIKHDVDIANELAQKISSGEWDQLDEVLAKAGPNKSQLLKALEQIVGNIKAYRPFLSDHLFMHGMVDLPQQPVEGQPLDPNVTDASEPADVNMHSLKVNRVVPESEAVDAVVPIGALAAPKAPKMLTLEQLTQVGVNDRPVAMLCLEVFNLDTLGKQIGSDVACSMYSKVTEAVHKAIQSSAGLLQPSSFPKHRLLVSWNAIQTTAEIPQDKALQAALEVQEALKTLNAAWREEHSTELEYGMAVTSGVVTAGVWGSEACKRFVVSGDSLAVLGTLTSLTGVLHTSILMDESTQVASRHRFMTRLVDVVDLSRSGLAVSSPKLQVFELLAATGEGKPRPEWMSGASSSGSPTMEDFTLAIKQLESGERSKAEQSIKRHLEVWPRDKAAQTRLGSIGQPGGNLPRRFRDKWDAPEPGVKSPASLI